MLKNINLIIEYKTLVYSPPGEVINVLNCLFVTPIKFEILFSLKIVALYSVYASNPVILMLVTYVSMVLFITSTCMIKIPSLFEPGSPSFQFKVAEFEVVSRIRISITLEGGA